MPMPCSRSRLLAPLALLLAAFLSAASPAQDPAAPARAPELERDEARRLAPPTPTAPAEQPMPVELERARLARLRSRFDPTLEGSAPLQIRALDEGFLDFGPEDQVLYSPGRTLVRYRDYTIEADRLIYDTRLQEFQAEGNVILSTSETTLAADSMRYNLRLEEGMAHNVSGRYGPVHFRMAETEADTDAPQLQRVSAQESIFRQSDVTTCDFKVPHYFIRGREVILFHGDRIFFRGATFYVSGVPILYLPVFTRTLDEVTPWFVQLGVGGRTGARIRLGYNYRHRTEEPSLEDPERMETRSAGEASVFGDLMSEIGAGAGLDYSYMFDYGRHRGELGLYGLNDKDRDVVGPDPADNDEFSETNRWRVGLLHRSGLAPDLDLLLNVDMFSDPDIFYDALDYFNRAGELTERDRVMERSARAALNWRQDDYVARLTGEIKDRVGIDRYLNPSNPRDDNRMFDLEPGVRLEDLEVDGISRDRWGRVTERIHATLATRWLPIGHRPLYGLSQIDLYRARDKGLNVVERDDDAWVSGIEIYHALMRQWKFSERYTLLTRAGVGIGAADRNDDDFGIDFGPTFPQQVDGLTFVDRDTFLIGTRERGFDDIQTFYAWTDAEARLNARFTDALSGWLAWRGRATTDDFIGDWYASLGSLTFREDLYDYPIREHWLESQLNYRLARPALLLYTRGGINLIPSGDLYAQEPSSYAQTGYRWSNQRATVSTGGAVGLRRVQIYDPSDPEEFQDNRLYASWDVNYTPIHRRWWTALELFHYRSLERRTEASVDRRLTFFTDEDSRGEIRWRIGRQIGPKWDAEFMVEYDQEIEGLRRVAWLLQRDLHDAIASLEIRLDTKNRRGDWDRVRNRDDLEANELDVRFGLALKLPHQEEPLGIGQPRTLRTRDRAPAMAF